MESWIATQPNPFGEVRKGGLAPCASVHVTPSEIKGHGPADVPASENLGGHSIIPGVPRVWRWNWLKLDDRE